MKTILIVDDELDIQSSLSFALRDEGYEVLTASSPKEALEILQKNAVDIGLYDVWFPDGDGIELLESTRKLYPEIVSVMMSGHGNIELALKSIRLGAYDFLEKPLELEKVLVILRNAAESLDLKKENLRLSKELHGKTQFIGDSQSIHQLKLAIQKAASAQSHVLVMGENGSGKELVARTLHHSSPRAKFPFVAVNCAAIPESLFESEMFGHEKGSFTGATQRQQGRFEQAGKGTIFLDEISELSITAQGKLLRVLEDRHFERVGGRSAIQLQARVIAATNKDLNQGIKAGTFREDLFFRLNILSIGVPPLRSRSGDIPQLVEHFLTKISQESGQNKPIIKPDLAEWMQKYEWPGNVRELRNLVERMLIMSSHQDTLSLADLPEELQVLSAKPSVSMSQILSTGTNVPLRDLRAQFETLVLDQRLKSFNGNVTKTAESLGIERAHLHRKLKQYGLHSSNVKNEEAST